MDLPICPVIDIVKLFIENPSHCCHVKPVDRLAFVPLVCPLPPAPSLSKITQHSIQSKAKGTNWTFSMPPPRSFSLQPPLCASTVHTLHNITIRVFFIRNAEHPPIGAHECKQSQMGKKKHIKKKKSLIYVRSSIHAKPSRYFNDPRFNCETDYFTLAMGFLRCPNRPCTMYHVFKGGGGYV